MRNLADIADLADQNARLFTILVASIASISLLVGGIGVMNIMLVSVTERTREIGIRMAIGATESDVQQQFLIEAVVLSLLGGGIGIIVGIGSSFLITHTLGWSVLVSPLAIVAAVIFSMGVGIFFGFYPHKKRHNSTLSKHSDTNSQQSLNPCLLWWTVPLTPSGNFAIPI